MRLVLALPAAPLSFTRPGTAGPFPLLQSVGTLRLAARAGQVSGIGATESTSLTVTLDNAGKRAARILGRPLRVPATVFDDAGDELFAGIVSTVKYGLSLELTLEAGTEGALLSEPLPLRTTRSLGDFAEDAILAHRYGDLRAARFKLIRLSDTRFFVADHPMYVDRVFVDGQETNGWARSLESDGAGHTWTVVTLTAPAPREAELSATGIGKLHPTTGALMENPAEIIEDLLRLAGGSDQWPGLRAEAAAAGIRLACNVDEAKSIREWIDRVTQSAVAIWSGAVGRLYPLAVSGPAPLRLEKSRALGLSVSASLTDTADVLRLGYDESSAVGGMQHFIELSASPRRFGGKVHELNLPMLRTPANAEAAGRRDLSRRAGERYDVSFDVTDAKDIRPGRWVELVANPEWTIPGADPVVMVTAVELANDSPAARVYGETILAYPEITVTAHSIALPNTRDASIAVAVADGVATFVVRDRSGAPAVDARVNIDGGPAKKTDATGRVSFPATPGEHKIAVQAPGKRAEIMTMLL